MLLKRLLVAQLLLRWMDGWVAWVAWVGGVLAGPSQLSARRAVCAHTHFSNTRLHPPVPAVHGLAVLRRHFPCEHGCTVELGADVPAYVMDANQTLHKYCLITQARCRCRCRLLTD